MTKRHFPYRKEEFGTPKTYAPNPSPVEVHVISKTGVELYNLPENFSGGIWIEFNLGGCSKVERKEKLK